jgi:hypothetical protein
MSSDFMVDWDKLRSLKTTTIQRLDVAIGVVGTCVLRQPEYDQVFYLCVAARDILNLAAQVAREAYLKAEKKRTGMDRT